MTLIATTATLALAGSVLAAAPVKVTLTTPGHSPKINTHWNYTVRATKAGKPASGKITVQIVDVVGGIHAVELGKSTKEITNLPFKGDFSDYITWPPISRGYESKVRITVHIGSTVKVLSYAVTPHG
jgi:hypothetical protein